MPDSLRWDEIKAKYPDKFLVLTNPKEEKLSDTKIKIVAAKVSDIFDDFDSMLVEYKRLKDRGEYVLYSLPSTMECIIEESPMMSCFQ